MSRDRSLDISVVGMAGRFPGAADVGELWTAVVEQRILTQRFSHAEVLAAGVDPRQASDPCYVPVHGRLRDWDRFDHAVFGISPHEAVLLDPQQRLLLECAWATLEDASHPFGQGDPLRTAVYAAASSSRHLRALLVSRSLDPPELEEIILATERDYLATRVAYKLGLTGPALTVSTACSSSLVGVHLAMGALNNGECDQALVLAVSANAPQAGYLHMPGGVLSRSGACRPFDAAADGALIGSGVMGIALRRYQDAVGDDLPTYGVLLGSAVNNDGTAKAGFLAPSHAGQERVIKSAVLAADIDASSVGYLEMHGTGTLIGDPIEWTAASSAYRSLGVPPGSIPVGALKGTIGHLDAASGLAGLIKAVLVIRHGRVPGVPGLNEPNPLLELEGSPLRLPRRAELWAGPLPRRAAVSSFGIGGTNAHILIEQAPARDATCDEPDDVPRMHLLALSASDAPALDRVRDRLIRHLKDTSPSLRDVSTALGRRAQLPHRVAIIAPTVAELMEELAGPVPGKSACRAAPLIFLLPGQGTQAAGMALPFAAALPGFSAALDDCLDMFAPGLRTELRQALYEATFPPERLRQTWLAQPALFAVEFSAGTALRDLGVKPSALVGHSVGELAAACLAGTLSLETAVGLVTLRGELMQDCAPGAMLALGCPASEAEAMQAESGADLAIAAINAPSETVLAGAPSTVNAFCAWLGGRARARVLPVDRAFHSPLIAPAADRLRRSLAQMTTGAAAAPWVTNIDGRLIPAGGLVTAEYFADAARRPVRFADALRTVSDSFPGGMAVEIGPGRVLSALAEASGLESMPLSLSPADDPAGESVLRCIGELWATGQPVNLAAVEPQGKHVRLPCYPFHGTQWPSPAQRGIRAAEAVELHAADYGLNTGPDAAKEEGSPAGVVRELWRELLGHDVTDPAADFFDLGGDSLHAARLARRISRRAAIDVDVRDLLIRRTLGDQIGLVEGLLVQQILGEAGEPQ
ncbi:MAG TPA: type I polyketide synthase [Streptosporangiaceae bacterium]